MTPEEFQNRIQLLEFEIARIIRDAPRVKAQEILGTFLFRIFNRGLDSSLIAIGQYKGGAKARYKALRNAKGLRIDTVDLQFTGALFRAINEGESGGDTVIGFTNVQRAKIARILEQKYGKSIFTPSLDEEVNAKELMVDYVKEQLRESARTIFS